jgi:hypothetical protein
VLVYLIIRTEWATTSREVAEVDAEGNTDAIAVGNSRDRALDISARILRVIELSGGERSSVYDSGRVVLDDGGVTKDSRNWDIGGLGANKTNKSGHQDRENGSGMHIGECMIDIEASCVQLVPDSWKEQNV